MEFAQDTLMPDAQPADHDATTSIADCPDIFALAAETMARRGYAGDPTHVELLYAIFTSRLLPRPMCAFLKAPSSSGKSWLLNRTLELFPPETYEIKSGFTPKAIAYGRSDLRHRILAIQEASGMQGREGNLLVRTLISEGLIRWEVAGRERDGFATREVVRPGPIAFVMTTTHNFLHGEDETRALSIQVDDTTAHTRRVLDSIAGRYSGEVAPEAVELAPWQAYQRWLAAGPRGVLIPFASAIAQHYWAQANRSKRDFEQVLTAIGVSALMHQAQRTTDAQGRVVATVDDYAKVRRFMLHALGEAAGAAISPAVRETYYAIFDFATANSPAKDNIRWPTMTELAAKLGIDKSNASRRVAKGKELGLIVDHRMRHGFPSRIGLGERMPDDTEVLPGVERVRGTGQGGEASTDAPGACAADATGPVTESASTSATPPEPTNFSALTLAAAPTPATMPSPAATPAVAPPNIPAVILNAPRPHRPDGGYRGRRAINAFRAAAEEMRERGAS